MESDYEYIKYLHERIIEEETKFDYAFTTLVFASLTLSIQFSLSYGRIGITLLYLSWVLYFISGISGGYTIRKRMKLKKYRQYKIWVQKLKESGSEGEKILKQRWKHKPDEVIKVFEFLKKKAIGKLKCAFWIQFITYIFAIILNLIFVSINHYYNII